MFLFLGVWQVQGQLSTNHFISPIHSRSSGQVEDHYVHLSTPDPNPFSVTITNGAGQQLPGSPVTISRGNPVRFTVGFGEGAPMFPSACDLGKPLDDYGLIISGASPFYVSFRVQNDIQAGYLTSKGDLAKGNQFRLGSIPMSDDNGLRNFYASAMATEDNTTVTFSDYDEGVVFTECSGTSSENTLIYNLDKGQTVTVSGYTNVAANQSGFVGALLSADKPITVNTGNATGGYAPNGQDHAIDQIVPVDKVGVEYIAIEGGGSAIAERPVVVATEDATSVFINGNTVAYATLNAGEFAIVENEFYQGVNHRNMYIESDKPIYVYQPLGGAPSNATPGMNFLPPLNCLLLTEVDLIDDVDLIGDRTFSGDIIATTQKDATLLINDVIVTDPSENVQGTDDWVTYRLSGYSGDVKVKSSGPLSVGVFGFNGAAGFAGYYSGFGFDGQTALVKICEGDGPINILEEIPGDPLGGGVWTPAFASDDNFFDPSVDADGEYNYTLTTDCSNINISVTILRTPTPTIGTISPMVACDEDRDGSVAYDFAVAKIDALDGQDPDVFTVLFYRSENDAEANINAIPDGAVNQNTSETLYARVTTIENFNCFAIAPFDFQIPEITADPGPPQSLSCEDENLTLDGSGSSGVGMLSYLWSTPDGTIEGSSTEAQLIVSSPGTYTLEVTDTQTGCSHTAAVTVTDDRQVVTAGTPTDLRSCDDLSDGDDTNGRTTFDLRSADAEVLDSNDSSISRITYHATDADAQSGTNPLPDFYENTSEEQTVYARLSLPNASCFAVTSFKLMVDQLPVSAPATLIQCDLDTGSTNASTDGITAFNLNEAYRALTTVPDLDLAFYESLADLNAGNAIADAVGYQNTTAFAQNLWVTLTNTAGCSRTETLTLQVRPTAASLPETTAQYVCDDDPLDGIAAGTFDIEDIRSRFYPTLETKFFLTREDASLEQNEVSGNLTTGTATLFVRIEDNNACQGIETIPLVVEEAPEIFIEDSYTVCEDTPLLSLTANPSADTYAWYLIEENGDLTLLANSPNITLGQNGNYRLEMTKSYGGGLRSCSNSKDFDLTISLRPVIEDILTTEFSDNNSITIVTALEGDYQYQLDNGAPQDSPIFANVAPGLYQITVIDNQGCGTDTGIASVLGFPKFFTPNGDGINDTWTLLGIPPDFQQVDLRIFNRFGKVIAIFRPNSSSWDGTYNNRPLPIDDYWFHAIFEDGRSFKGHFTLKY
ncbi:MAG: T9SS type B sorting domain-containing protein [Leeuwenhoekiella sp.]